MRAARIEIVVIRDHTAPDNERALTREIELLPDRKHNTAVLFEYRHEAIDALCARQPDVVDEETLAHARGNSVSRAQLNELLRHRAQYKASWPGRNLIGFLESLDPQLLERQAAVLEQAQTLHDALERAEDSLVDRLRFRRYFEEAGDL